MATATATLLQSHHCVSPKFPYLQIPNLTPRFSSLFPRKVRVLTFREKFRGRDRVYYSVCCFRKNNSEIEAISVDENENERPPFDLNLAVVLAGFAFEAYTSPPAKTEEWVQSTKDTTNATKDRTASAAESAKDKTASAAQSAQEFAQHGKDQSAGFLQQTGEQVNNIAQNAVDSVKNMIGMAENNAKK